MSKKTKQHIGQTENYKRTNNDLENIHKKQKNRVTRTPLKTGVNSGAPEG
jgi:plasmid replication initiation protein